MTIFVTTGAGTVYRACRSAVPAASGTRISSANYSPFSTRPGTAGACTIPEAESRLTRRSFLCCAWEALAEVSSVGDAVARWCVSEAEQPSRPPPAGAIKSFAAVQRLGRYPPRHKIQRIQLITPGEAEHVGRQEDIQSLPQP